MPYPVTFYSFAKEVNSTKRPTGTGTVLDCTVNDRINIISPVISVNLGRAGSMAAPLYNYCYIPIFQRYYFVENWEYRDGLWWASCSVDVLATYKTQISALRAYVLRSAEDFDGTITDGLYPAKNLFTTNYVANTGNKTWFDNLNSGTYVVGIIGNGATKFFAFNRANFASLIAYMLDKDYANAALTALEVAAYPEAKAILDPLQYISSVIYYPVSFTTTTYTEQTIKVGYVDCTATCAEVDGLGSGVTSVESVQFDFEGYTNHPYASTRGVYLNYAPWTRRYLYIPPFGIIELDATEMDSTTTATVQIDMITGGCRLHVFGLNGMLMTELKTQLGIPIQIGQVIAKGMGILTITQKLANITSQVMGGMTGGGGTGLMYNNMHGGEWTGSHEYRARQGALAGGIASGISGTVGFIKDGIESKIPSAKSVGSMGGIVDLKGTPFIYSVFATPVDESRNSRGRPLCQERILGSLAANHFSGYILVADPDINDISATGNEIDMISSYLTGGFYLA